MGATNVKLSIVYPLIWDASEIDVKWSGGQCRVTIQRISRQEADPLRPEFEFAQGTELLEDRQGRVAIAQLDMLFNARLEPESTVRQAVNEVVNRILEVYRFEMDEFHVAAIPPGELGPLIIRCLNDDGSPTRELSFAHTFGAGIALARTASISNAARDYLLTGKQYPVWKILVLNAKREHVFGNHRLAIVEMESAIEALVDHVVADGYCSKSVSDAKIEAILECGLKNLMTAHLDAVNRGVSQTQEYSDWDSAVYERRNEIVHDGASATFQEAEEALAVGQRLVALIDR